MYGLGGGGLLVTAGLGALCLPGFLLLLISSPLPTVMDSAGLVVDQPVRAMSPRTCPTRRLADDRRPGYS